MIDNISGHLAVTTPFMTGAYKDALANAKPVFATITLSDPMPESVAQPVATAAPRSQKFTTDADLRQLFGPQPAALVLPATAAVVAPAALVAPAVVVAPPVVVAAPVVAAPAFAPAFRSVTGSCGDGSHTFEMNATYFATRETAQWIASKYGTGEVVEIVSTSGASGNEYHARLADGRLVNAGLLAGYYQRNPPDRFPGLADRLIRDQLHLA